MGIFKEGNILSNPNYWWINLLHYGKFEVYDVVHDETKTYIGWYTSYIGPRHRTSLDGTFRDGNSMMGAMKSPFCFDIGPETNTGGWEAIGNIYDNPELKDKYGL